MHLRVKDLMSAQPHACAVSEPASAAARIMWEHDCGIVPVVSGDGRLVGVVTDRDICMATYLQGRPPAEIPVRQLMTREPIACHPDDEVLWAEHLMAERQIHRLPVVDHHGAPVGMLSLGDLARGSTASGDGRRKGDLRDDLLQTMAAIARPRVQSPLPH